MRPNDAVGRYVSRLQKRLRLPRDFRTKLCERRVCFQSKNIFTVQTARVHPIQRKETASLPGVVGNRAENVRKRIASRHVLRVLRSGQFENRGAGFTRVEKKLFPCVWRPVLQIEFPRGQDPVESGKRKISFLSKRRERVQNVVPGIRLPGTERFKSLPPPLKAQIPCARLRKTFPDPGDFAVNFVKGEQERLPVLLRKKADKVAVPVGFFQTVDQAASFSSRKYFF